MSGSDVIEALSLFHEESGGANPTLPHQNGYDKAYSWQYAIRLANREADLFWSGLTKEYTQTLTTKDFIFKTLSTDAQKKQAINFIKNHEWLGNISQFTTHWFGAYHKNILAGVILMNMPNAFSKLMGEDTRKIERLISRGACISWSPPNLASNFMMWCIGYMAKNTPYRLFTAYADIEAKELGTIYQACNFYYLGKNAGTSTRYINPYTGKIVSDRFFRVRSAYKKYAQELKITWQKNWSNDQRMLWENIPDDIEKQLRDFSKMKQLGAEKIVMPSKHKYAYVLGANRKETKLLREMFLERNRVYEYPKVRGS
jgi:hypothetical protein